MNTSVQRQLALSLSRVVPLFAAFALVVALSGVAHADYFEIFTPCGDSGSGTTPTSVSCTGTYTPPPAEGGGSGTVNASGAITNSASFGSMISMSGDSPNGGVLLSIGTSITIGGPSSGTPVDLLFVLSYSGKYSYSESQWAGITEDYSLGIGGFNAGGVDSWSLCSTGCDLSSPTGIISGSLSDLVHTTTGSTIGYYVGFSNNVSSPGFSSGSISVDLLDPMNVTVFALDPSTGALLSGITVTGADGTQFPVNPSSVPEPSSMLLLAGGFAAIMGITRRR